MSEQEKKRQRIYDLLNTETKTNFLVYCIQSKKKKKKNTEKELFKEKRTWRIKQKI